jgi:hypothetical protein
MECLSDAEKIACAVSALGDISWFQILAVLVLPAMLGAVTLVVAIASLRVARSSLKLSESIVMAADEATKKKTRLDLANEIYRWAPRKWNPDSAGPSTVVEAMNGLSMITANLEHSGFEGAAELGKILWRLEDVETGKGQFEKAFMCGALAGATASIVKDWLERPNSVAIAALTLDGRIAKVKQKAKKNQRRIVKTLDKKIAVARASAADHTDRPRQIAETVQPDA